MMATGNTDNTDDDRLDPDEEDTPVKRLAQNLTIIMGGIIKKEVTHVDQMMQKYLDAAKNKEDYDPKISDDWEKLEGFIYDLDTLGNHIRRLMMLHHEAVDKGVTITPGDEELEDDFDGIEDLEVDSHAIVTEHDIELTMPFCKNCETEPIISEGYCRHCALLAQLPNATEALLNHRERVKAQVKVDVSSGEEIPEGVEQCKACNQLYPPEQMVTSVSRENIERRICKWCRDDIEMTDKSQARIADLSEAPPEDDDDIDPLVAAVTEAYGKEGKE